jgi:putative ABC transport system substrate-binding protein
MASAAATRAQQAGKRYTVGILNAGAALAELNAAFFDALREFGWVEGKNVVFERRYAENRLERLPELAADLVRLKVDLIAAAQSSLPCRVGEPRCRGVMAARSWRNVCE